MWLSWLANINVPLTRAQVYDKEVGSYQLLKMALWLLVLLHFPDSKVQILFKLNLTDVFKSVLGFNFIKIGVKHHVVRL